MEKEIDKNKIELGTSERITSELVKGSIIVQGFEAKGKKLKSIGLDFGTYGRINPNHIVVKILDKDDKKYFEKKFESKLIQNNKFNTMKCDIDLKPGKMYYMLVYSPDGIPGNSVSAKYSNTKTTNESLHINGKPIDGTLHCFFIYDKIKEAKKEIIKKSYTVDYIKGLISIVIPCHNDSSLLSNTLESISYQDYTFNEVIIVDDGSNADEKKQVKEIIKQFKDKIFVLSLKSIRNNVGASEARNIGAKIARGEYLFFCDSDVTLQNNCLIKMIQTLHDNPEYSWSYCNYLLGDEEKIFNDFNLHDFYRRNLSSTMSLLKKEDFPGFDKKLKRLQDWDLFLTMIENEKCGKWINEILFKAEKRLDGITFNSISWTEAIKELKKKHKFLEG